MTDQTMKIIFFVVKQQECYKDYIVDVDRPVLVIHVMQEKLVEDSIVEMVCVVVAVVVKNRKYLILHVLHLHLTHWIRIIRLVYDSILTLYTLHHPFAIEMARNRQLIEIFFFFLFSIKLKL
eukprot:UN07216